MHEFGLCEEIVAVIRRRAQGRRVARVAIRAGALHRVDDAALKQAFSWAATDTEAQGASLDIVPVPIRTRCGQCTKESENVEIVPICASCGSSSLEILQGDELIVESIEYEKEFPGP